MGFLSLILFKLTFILSLWVNVSLAQGRELDRPSCPIGFFLAFKKDTGEALCYRQKDPEIFSDKYKDCAGNLYTSELLQELNFSKTDLAVWTEYRSMYPGGVFYDWSFTKNFGKIFNDVNDVSIHSTLDTEEELCLVLDPVSNYTAVKCNKRYYSYCVIKPYISEGSFKGCKELKKSFRFQSPDSTCLINLTGDGINDLRVTWNEAQELCKKNGALLLNQGWKYSNHPVFRRSSTSHTYPLGIIRNDNHSPLRLMHDIIKDDSQVQVQVQVQITRNESNFRDTIKNPDALFGSLKDNLLSFVNESYVFDKVICELRLDIRNVNLEVAINVNNNITLTVNDSLHNDDIYCFTDSVKAHPIEVSKRRIDDTNVFILSPNDDGYYWCTHRNTIIFNPAQSNKVLFLRERESLVNTYSIKLKLNSDLNIFYRTKFVQNFGDLNSNLTEDFLKEFKNSKPGVIGKDKSILSMKLKRMYLDRRTVLVHVELNPDMKPVTPGSWDGLKVLHMKAAYYCKGFDSIPDTALGGSQLNICENYTCIGDFNEGVEWNEMAQDSCINHVDTSLDIDKPKEKLEQMIQTLDSLVNKSSPVMVEDISDVFDQVEDILEVNDSLEIPSRLLHLLDSLGSTLNLNGSPNATAVRNNIALVLADAAPSHPVRGMKIANRTRHVSTNETFEIFYGNLNDTDLDSDRNEVVVYLPSSLSATSRRVSFIVFSNDRAFRSKENVYSVNSRIVSVKIDNITKFENGEVIDIHFNPNAKNIYRNESRVCAYWQFLANGTGYWSQEGCTFIFATRPGMLSTCRCNHLTHFAEALYPRAVFSQKNEEILELLTIIGCCLSIFGLFFVSITAVLFRSWRRDFSNKIWLQLCISIFLSVLIFLIVIFAKFEEHSTPCMLLGVVLHYSVLSSFCWMLVAAVLSYRRLVIVFTIDASHKLLRASAFAWGTPCAIIVILLSISSQAYNGRFDEKSPTGSFCYPSGLALWISVYAPIATILVINWILFALIVRSVFASRGVQRHGESNEALRCASVSCLLVFLFGLPWISGLFAFNVVMAYMFTLTATYQGLILFLLLVLGNKKTRDLWFNNQKNKQIRMVQMSFSAHSNKSTDCKVSTQPINVETSTSKAKSVT